MSCGSILASGGPSVLLRWKCCYSFQKSIGYTTLPSLRFSTLSVFPLTLLRELVQINSKHYNNPYLSGINACQVEQSGDDYAGLVFGRQALHDVLQLYLTLLYGWRSAQNGGGVGLEAVSVHLREVNSRVLTRGSKDCHGQEMSQAFTSLVGGWSLFIHTSLTLGGVAVVMEITGPGF